MLRGYFDNNATTPLWPEAKAAWNETVDSLWMNPSSPYRGAAKVHVHLEAARNEIAGIFEIAPSRVVFNSGATEGNNAVFNYWSRTLPETARVGVSPTEHPSVTEAARRSLGGRLVWLPLDKSGAVDFRAIDFEAFSAVSLMAANNETGILNDWAEIAKLCRESQVIFHCDASQWIGKMSPIGLGACDIVTGCGHKFGGPRGTGFWLLREGMDDFRGQSGGVQESNRRAGTPDVAGVRAMLAALKKSYAMLEATSENFRNDFEQSLADALPSSDFIGAGVPRLWNTSCVVLPEFSAARWIRALEKLGFFISAGAACSTGHSGPSPVLEAMGFNRIKMDRTVRISSSWSSSSADWRALVAAILRAHKDLRNEPNVGETEVISL